MSELKWIDGDRIRCYGCKRWVGLIFVRRDDGYCPVCRCPIDLDDSPYSEKEDMEDA